MSAPSEPPSRLTARMTSVSEAEWIEKLERASAIFDEAFAIARPLIEETTDLRFLAALIETLRNIQGHYGAIRVAAEGRLMQLRAAEMGPRLS